MKIVYCIRPEFQNGGDGIQVMKTKEYIERLFKDCKIDIVTSPERLNNTYDIAHIFNYATVDFTRSFFKKALALNLKVVSSPIYWDYKYSIMPLYMYFWCNKKSITESFVKFHQFFHPILSKFPKRFVFDAFTNVSKRFSNDIHFFIDNSQLILPNSQREGELCCQFGHVQDQTSKIREIYNGVDIERAKILSEQDFFAKYNIPHDYVLQVGRIEYLKNQMNLIAALADCTEIPIVFLGFARKDRPYTKQLKKLADRRGNVYFLEGIPHADVYSFYKYARVHVLLSMRESPGLVSLEALSQGCPVVISDERFLPVRTYFKKCFKSVNPYSIPDIKEAILELYNKKHEYVDMSEFSWENVAKQTYLVYKEVYK